LLFNSIVVTENVILQQNPSSYKHLAA